LSRWVTFRLSRWVIFRLSLLKRHVSSFREDNKAHQPEWYMGWSSYYRMTQYPAQLVKIESHIRRRLRSRLVAQQKGRRHLFEKLVKRGASWQVAAKAVYSNKRRWALSHTRAVDAAYPNRWFIGEMGLKVRSTEKHQHWFDIRQWVKVT